jgi:RNA polymerase sigma factor (sigma-70 family)
MSVKQEQSRIDAEDGPRRLPPEAVRKRAAVELIRRHEAALRRTARRFSLCAEDADDAYQRALEILLTKAPTADPRELIRWTQTVTRHEALAVRRARERTLAAPAPGDGDDDEAPDWVQLIPSPRDGPADLAERRERVARTREALQTLKPQELRALTLLAEGYSYAEIGQITGWSYTKINRCLAEGRSRFRSVLESSEQGRRCDDLSPLLSAFCDGEAETAQDRVIREHLRACAHCRSKLRTFRAAPQAAAALAPVLPLSRPLTERAQELFAALQTRLPGRSGLAETAASQLAAAGGSRGAGMAVIAKVLAACVGTAGGAAACVAAGVVPGPLDPTGAEEAKPALERVADRKLDRERSAGFGGTPAPAGPTEPAPPEPGAPTATAPPTPTPPPPPPPAPEPEPAPSPEPTSVEFGVEPAPAPSTTSPTSSPSPAPTSSSTGGGGSSGGDSARAEFGP